MALPSSQAPQGLSPFALACLIAGCYQAYCFKWPDYIGLGAYAFPVAVLTGPLAWREIKASGGKVHGKLHVVIGLGASWTLLFLKLFRFV